MDGSIGQVQQTPVRRWRLRLSATGQRDSGSSVNPVKTVGVQTCQLHDVHQSAPHQWLLAMLHQQATCLLSSYQHDGWSLIAESSPHQNGRTFSSVLFNCNSETAVRFTPTFLGFKVTVLYTSHSQLTRVMISSLPVRYSDNSDRC